MAQRPMAIYLPLDLWKAAGKLKGKKGGNLLAFENVGRRMNNTEFVGLVSGSWVGISIEQSAILEQLIRQVLSSGKNVTFAVKHIATRPDYQGSHEDELDGESQMDAKSLFM